MRRAHCRRIKCKCYFDMGVTADAMYLKLDGSGQEFSVHVVQHPERL